MTTEVATYLEQINAVSRQILSRLLSFSVELEADNVPIEGPDDLLASKSLNSLVSKRQTLVTYLFTHSSPEAISAHNALLQEMIDLDSQLTGNSERCKQAIAQQALALQKNKKAAKSYQKY